MSTFKFDGDDAAWVEFMKAAIPGAMQRLIAAGIMETNFQRIASDAAGLADHALAEWNARRPYRSDL
jgi:hypothetical protein